ncbi:Hsp20/alpha crystallin family protein [Paenibacillus sp. KN14-4R]|uniref:Hsp20/alpha crystallin family protein n=1 Tax=Paenibacillus sp. KN14-4R TaxID=3445773 RepID=UPI003FA00020
MMSPNTKNANWFSDDPFFNNKLPLKGLGDNLNLDPSFVEKYVKDVLKQASVNSMHVGKSHLPYELFEMHNAVIAKIQIPKDIKIENLSISINTSQIKIEGLPTEQRILLNIPVVPSKSSATFKQDFLQIKMPKLSKGNFVEVPIRYL